MKVDFRVHGVASSFANVKTEVDGEQLNASVPSLEVELVTVSERNGNLTLRFVGGGIEDAKKLFQPNAVVSAEFSAAAYEKK